MFLQKNISIKGIFKIYFRFLIYKILKNKNNKKNKDIEKINKNSESDDNFMFFDDNIL